MNPVEYTGRENRITFQLYHYWFGLAEDCGIPPLKSLSPADIAPYKNNMVLIDLRDPDSEPTLQVIGQLLKEDLDQDLNLKGISEIPRRTLLSRITDHYMEVLANGVPISFDAEFKNKAREKIFYRGILLPFSDDGKTINFILGAIRWITEDELAAKKTPDVIQSDERPAPDIAEPVPEGTVPAQPAPTETVQEQNEADALPVLTRSLEACRALVQGQAPADQRSRRSLYEALGAILDFHLLCTAHSNSYAALLTAKKIKAQKRAPFTPALKLCFGRDYDKTRLTEYAAALSFAGKNQKVGKDMPGFLDNFPGGIKGCVRAERDSHSAADKPAKKSTTDSREVINHMPPLARIDLDDDDNNNDGGGDDYCLLLARRQGSHMDVVKIVQEDEKILEAVLDRTAKDHQKTMNANI